MSNQSTTTKNALSALSAVSALSADFTFCLPADCREANYALLLADRYMRWFEDFDPYGVEFDDRAAVLLESAAALLRADGYAARLLAELESALGEIDEEDRDGDLYQDGKAILDDIRAYLAAINPRGFA